MAMRWAFDAHWRNLKDRFEGFVHRYWAVEVVAIILALLSFFPVFYILGVFVVAGEEFVEAIGKLRWRLSQPRRHLLSETEVAKRRETKLKRDEVKALPKMRPRALTLRSDDGTPALKDELRTHDRSRVKQNTVDQLGACDLWRFPFEVRETIWKYAVGGNHVHIVKRRQRWGSVYCPAKDPTDPVHRDFCTRRDEDGYHVMSAWPTDTKPLALLRYSECIDFLYSHNTFAFDDSALLCAFLGSVLPSRACIITSFHLVPVLERDWDSFSHRDVFVAVQLSIASFPHLGRFLDVLEQHPTIHSLTITPKFGLDFAPTCHRQVIPAYIHEFTHKLNLLKASTPVTLAWPEEPTGYVLYTSVATMMALSPSYWGREMYLPPANSRNFHLRMIPWQSPTGFMAFFIPFDVRCLHCASYTIIRRGTGGRAEVSFLPLSLSCTPPENVTLSQVLIRYWTFHVFCGGWIEFQYHGGRKEWSVLQGAQIIPAEEADRHLAEKEGLERQYPPAENPHERLKGITVGNVLDRVGVHRYGMRDIIDEPTMDAYYRNVGWQTGQAQGT
ncbi:hypothetical protein P171DRAFT_440108 [Karstenula rhodostoma CBS 690.94]|uniref:DUF7730 domain-containing protein n=1 Tax=Karstenula rhodostoma CBS 690.94 TaxID=1392251 RepID=A0A9P4PSY6_9PLEO|nr:hypothetical protein P171DRAFT_440108 [Karstenula rhodostoma CBS 690.94]